MVRPTGITATCPTWSPGYDRWAYANQGKIHIRRVDGTADRVIETDFSRLSIPVWSPDGGSLVFAGQRYSHRGGLDIWRLDLSTQDVQELVTCAVSPSAIDSCDSPAWLPDGRLSYIRRSRDRAGIEVFDLLSNDIQVLANELQILPISALFGVTGLYDSGICSNLAWSPDKSRIAFVGGRGIFPDGASVYILSLANKAISRVTPAGIWADSPAWLDDTHLLFRSTTWAKGAEVAAYAHEKARYEAQNIAIINLNSGQIVKLTDIAPPSSSAIICPFWIPRSTGEQIMSLTR